MNILPAAALAGLLLAAGGCGSSGDHAGTSTASLPEGSERVHLQPADFTTQIDNRYWPMKPGSRWIYRKSISGSPSQRVVVTVTNKTKRIANGIEARVVRDVSTQRGVAAEVTDDWYAQDA